MRRLHLRRDNMGKVRQMKPSKALTQSAKVTGHVYMGGTTVMCTVEQGINTFYVIRRPDCTYLHLAADGYIVPDLNRRASIREIAVSEWIAKVNQLEPPF